MTKRIIISLSIVFACMFVWLAYCLIRNGFDVSRIPIPEYNNLFTAQTQSALQHPYVYKSKIKEPASNYIFNNDFHLTINRVVLTNNKSLPQILHIQNGHVNRSYEPYTPYAEDSQLKMTETSNKVSPVSTINFTYQGNLKIIIENDTLACYYLKFKEFSLFYDKNSDNDIWANTASSNGAAINLAFIKKKKYVYIILLFKTKNETQDFQPDSLFQLIKQ